MISHSWISECLEVFGVAENTEKFLVNSINKWKRELTSNGVTLGRGLFKKDVIEGEGRGYPKMVTNGDIGGSGYVQMLKSQQYFFNINIFHISYYFHHILSNLNEILEFY